MGCPVKGAKSHSVESCQPLTLPASGRMSPSVLKRESGQHAAASTLEKKVCSPHCTLIFGTSVAASLAEATHFRSHETTFSSCFLCLFLGIPLGICVTLSKGLFTKWYFFQNFHNSYSIWSIEYFFLIWGNLKDSYR